MDSKLEIDCLLQSISKGNEQTFQKLFMLYKDKTYSIAMAFTENSFDAEEIVQDVFLRIWKYRSRLADIQDFNPWIHKVTRNCALSSLKRRAIEFKRREDIMDCLPTKVSDTEHLIEEKEFQSILKKAVSQLSPQQKKIFELARIQGKDRKSIAQSLGLSSATVSVHLTIAIRVVRTFLYTNNYKALTGLFLLHSILG